MLCAFVYIYILSVCIICMYVIRSISNIEYIINNECHVLIICSVIVYRVLCVKITFCFTVLYVCYVCICVHVHVYENQRLSQRVLLYHCPSYFFLKKESHLWPNKLQNSACLCLHSPGIKVPTVHLAYPMHAGNTNFRTHAHEASTLLPEPSLHP